MKELQSRGVPARQNVRAWGKDAESPPQRRYWAFKPVKLSHMNEPIQEECQTAQNLLLMLLL